MRQIYEKSKNLNWKGESIEVGGLITLFDFFKSDVYMFGLRDLLYYATKMSL